MTETIRSRTLAVDGPVFRRISWSAIVAGVVLAGAVELLLNLLGLSIGLWTVDMDAAAAFGVAAGVWWLGTALVSVFIGGWAASHLAGIPRRSDGVIHGLLVWSLGSLLMLWLVGTATGAAIGGAASMLRQTAGNAGGLVKRVAPEAATNAAKVVGSSTASMADITAEMAEALTGPDAEATRRDLGKLMAEAHDDTVNSVQFRQQLVDLLVMRGDVDRDRAERLADSAIAQLNQVRRRLAAAGEQAKVVSEDLAHSTAKAALWAFLAVLAGAVAAAFGGRVGTPPADRSLRVLPAET